MKVSAIVITYTLNHQLLKMTQECIQSLTGYDELIVVDNGSAIMYDGEADKKLFIPKNQGLVQAINMGMLQAVGSHVVIVSNDTKLLSGNLRMLAGDGIIFPQVSVDDPTYETPLYHGVVYGMPNQPLFTQDELFTTYFADTDMFYRAKLAGVPISVSPKVTFHHYLHQTGGLTGERKRGYEQDRDIFFQKHGFDIDTPYLTATPASDLSLFIKEVCCLEKLTARQRAGFDRVDKEAFPFEEKDPQRQANLLDRSFGAQDREGFLIAFHNNEVIGKLSFYCRVISHQRVPIILGGIRGVAVKREFQHHHVASTMLYRAMLALKQRFVDVVLLRTDIPHLYEPFGFKKLKKPYLFKGHKGKVYREPHGMLAPLLSKAKYEAITNSQQSLDIGTGDW